MGSKKITSAVAGVLIALTGTAYAETTVTLPDVNADIYGKLSYMGYYNDCLLYTSDAADE